MTESVVITERSLLEAIVAGAVLTTDHVAKAQAMLDKMEENDAKRAAKSAEKAKEYEPVMNAIHALLVEKGGMTAPDIATALSTAEEPMSTSKAVSMCRKLVEAGRAVQGEIKIAKKGKLKLYTAI